MTKHEAIKAMSEGRKVTHQYFDEHEYVRMRQFGSSPQIDPSMYVLSDKYPVSATMFWNDRSGPHWNEGWSIFD
jgi:hypothetical protein